MRKTVFAIFVLSAVSVHASPLVLVSPKDGAVKKGQGKRDREKGTGSISNFRYVEKENQGCLDFPRFPAEKYETQKKL